jgi:hypothetical protein
MTEKIEEKPKAEVFPLDQVELPLHRTTILYGQTGKRKTTTACRMVKERGLLISADHSWDVLFKPENKALRNIIDLRIYDGLSELDYIDYSGYDTIIADPITSMVDRFGDLLLKDASWAGKFREKLSTINPELKGVTTKAMIDYMVIRDAFQPALNRLMTLPAHIIFTAHVNSPIKVTQDTDMTLRPSLPGKTWEIISKPASIIGYIETKGRDKVTVNVSETASYCVAKSRVSGISGVMDLEEFIKAYREIVL